MDDDWRPIVESINRDRRKSLINLDALVKEKPVAMRIFSSGLARFAGHYSNVEFVSAPSVDMVKAEIATFLNQNRIELYDRKVRLSVVGFCINNFISPSMFGPLVDQFVAVDRNSIHWSELLHEDSSLNCVYHAGIAEQL